MATDGSRGRGSHPPDDSSWAERLRRRTGGSGLSCGLLVAAVLIGALSSAGAAVAAALNGASAARRPQAVTAAPRLPHGARAVGTLSATTPVTGAVALKLSDE